jgi:hypothetical protein
MARDVGLLAVGLTCPLRGKAWDPCMNDHHMIREIHEQPKAFEKIVRETRPRIQEIVRKASSQRPQRRTMQLDAVRLTMHH